MDGATFWATTLTVSRQLIKDTKKSFFIPLN
jgi:hypothetical protein